MLYCTNWKINTYLLTYSICPKVSKVGGSPVKGEIGKNKNKDKVADRIFSFYKLCKTTADQVFL